MAIQIQLRRGDAADWTSTNPILAEGEVGVEIDTLKLKVGNGTDNWNTLPYFGSAGTVTSVGALTLGTSGTDLSSTVANGTTTPVITLNVPTASATNRGVLSSADWTTFNNKGNGTVTSVTGTSPVNSSGGATPAISLASGYGDTLNPYASKTANYVLASPDGSSGVPTFRAIVASDIPTLNQNTTGTAANITATSNSTLTTLSALSLPYSQLSGTVPTWNQNTTGTASNVTGTVAIANGGSGTTTAQGAMNAFAGAVTSGSYLRGNGADVVMSAIQVADVPTLNQNTTGTASNVTGIVAVANGGTGQTTQTAAFDALAPTTTKGDLIVNNGTDNVRVAVGTDGYVLSASSAASAGVAWIAASAGSSADIQEFTSTGTSTWTKPAGAKLVYVLLFAGGSGGGSGRRRNVADAALAGGGTGGSAGGRVEAWIPAVELGATESVVVGAGGTGGAARTVDNTNGVTGGSGAASTFSFFLAREATNGGGGGTSTGAGSGGSSGGTNTAATTFAATFYTAGGGAGSNGTGNPAAASRGGMQGGGGGGGGGIAANGITTYTPAVGGLGGAVFSASQTSTGGGGAAGTSGVTATSGTAGAAASTDFFGGSGGGGGGSATAGTAGSGGSGGYPGGGGGGGGSSNSGFDSGAGGNGGDGYVRVVTFF